MKRLPILIAVLFSMIALSSCKVPVESRVGLVRMGASSTVSMGLVAVPDAEEATEIAKEAKKVLDETILPIINGDEAGLASGVEQILDLEAFNKPKLAKFKAIVQSALPLLMSVLPEDLIEQGEEKLSDEAVAYIKAFFEGMHNGVETYLGESRALGVDCDQLRKKLSE